MRRLLFALVALVSLGLIAQARERIQNFTSDATVNVDGSLDVTETIAITVEGDVIKHGIYRDFPTTYTNDKGLRVVVGFDVLAVKRDGDDEPYTLEGLSNGERVKIGSRDTYVSRGLHRYEITYRTTRQLGFFEKYDELYWNVTGNGWTFPIDQATAIVTLPNGATILQSTGYTGYQGQNGLDFELVNGKGNIYRAKTTRSLSPGEGFTVAVGWQKGIVASPSDLQKRVWFLKDNSGIMGLIATLLGTTAYFYFTWAKVGRDPPKGTIIPLFVPPQSVAPAAARYIWSKRFDDKSFAASLVGLAVKGWLKIGETSGDFAITNLTTPGRALSKAETALLNATPAGITSLQTANYAAISRMKSAIQGKLATDIEGPVFLRNTGWFMVGALLSIAGLLISVFLMGDTDSFAGLFLAGWSGIWWGVIVTLGWSALNGLIKGYGFMKKLGSLMSVAFLIPFAVAGIAVPAFMIFSGNITPHIAMLGGAALGLIVINILFRKLLFAPTVPGRQLMDQVEGFRMYLKTAEEERLKILNPPTKTPELFERYLPYALALDCENEWNAKFTQVLAAAAIAGASAPYWYSGNSWNTGNMGGFTRSLGDGLASSAASAAQAPGPSSSSGGGFSGGGGSSGGGGGGGGGGGW